MKELVKKSKGITLIALVITIIVLLILAGVSISMVIGDNGILKQANTAKTKTAEAEEAEEKALADLKTEMDNWISSERKPENNKPEGDTLESSLPADFFDFDAQNKTILGINQKYIGKPEGNVINELDVYYYIPDDYNASSYNVKSYLEGNGWCILKEPIDTLVVPAKINGVQVETIRNIGALNVRKVVIEEGIKNIEKAYAIYEWNSAVNARLSEYLMLEEFIIPSTIEKIGDYAFFGCTTLESIMIPNSVTYMGKYAFSHWLNSQKIYLASQIDYYNWNSNWYSVVNGFDTDANIIYYYGS